MEDDPTKRNLSRRPILHKKETVVLHVKSKGRILAGYVGEVPARLTVGFVQFCQRRKHYHRKLGGYALSDKLFRRLEHYQVKRVFFAETDTGDVYEYTVHQFDTSVPQWAKGEREKHENQSYVEADDAVHRFENHAEHIMLGERES